MHGTRRFLLAGATALGLVLVQLPAPVAARAAAMPSDFNGDGYADLAIGVPGEVVGAWDAAGAVNVLYGSPTGLTAVGDQLWTQDTPGVRGRGGRMDLFGDALASGDFNRDGYADLAVGVPRDRAGGVDDAGAVNVLYGSKHGLKAAGDQRWSQATLPGTPAAWDWFGTSLAAADVNGDGYADLAIGAPGDGDGGFAGAGSVIVLSGGPDGLTGIGSTILSPAMTGSAGGFGARLAAGDLDADGFADLAVGAPWFGDGAAGGDVSAFYGSPGGLQADGSELWTQDSPGIADASEPGDHFGASLAIGDFDDDGYDDVAVGVPNEDLPCAEGADCLDMGAVVMIGGSATGLTATDSQLWHQDIPGVPGAGHAWESFGDGLAAGDFNGDGADDLAIGVDDTVRLQQLAGAVVVLYGGAGGLATAGAQRWTQATAGVPGRPSAGAQFGFALAAADYGRSGRADLAIGVPEEGSGEKDASGGVNVLYGRSSGLSSVHAQHWRQDTPGVRGGSEYADLFGSSLTP